MSGNLNKDKGKRGERELCKILEKEFGGSWIRTAGSGNYVGGINAKRAQYLSETQLLSARNDIIPPDEYKFAAIECKNYEEFEFHLLLKPTGASKLNKWIDQVKESSYDEINDFPCICFKPNRKGWYLVCKLEYVSQLDLGKLNFSIYRYKEKAYLITDMLEFFHTYKEEIKDLFTNGCSRFH